jgi:hypothetical protein
MKSLSIDIPTVLVAHVEPALARLGYLHADIEWTFDADSKRLTARYGENSYEPQELRKEALFQLYREKIFQDTLAIRSRIYEAI